MPAQLVINAGIYFVQASSSGTIDSSPPNFVKRPGHLPNSSTLHFADTQLLSILTSGLPHFMDHQEEIPSLSTTLVYLKRHELYSREKPFVLLVDVSHIPGARQTNVIQEQHHNLPIRDVRGEESEFKLDVHGFELWTCEDGAKAENIETGSWADDVYIPELEKALVAKLGAKEAHVIHFGVREILSYVDPRSAEQTDREIVHS